MAKETTLSRGPQLKSDLRIGPPPDIASMRLLAKNEPEAFFRKMDGLIEERDAWGKRKLSWNRIHDLKAMYLGLSDIKVQVHYTDMGRQRAVMASAFPALSGNLTVAGVNDALNGVPTIGQELVTEMDDNKRFTTIVGITSSDPSGVDRVEEGDDFPPMAAGEETFGINSKRQGRRISITKEMIEENDLANIINRVDALGEWMAETVEKQTIDRVTDFDGGNSREPYTLLLSKVGTTLYTSSANNPGARAPSGTRVNNNALTDLTDLEAARLVLAAMTNDRGERIAIPVNESILLVPDALLTTAWSILKSVMVSGVENEESAWGLRGMFQPRLLSSPKLDDRSTSAWYLGMFKKQFKRKWKLRQEIVSLGENTESYLRSRIAFQSRVAFDVEIGATNYVFVVQSLTGSTSPS